MRSLSVGQRKSILPLGSRYYRQFVMGINLDKELIKKVGNIDQLAGIRESVLLRGRGEGTKLAEVYNASGLRFSVMPDRCMDIYDLSFKGINISFLAKNGIVSPLGFSPADGEFPEQWTGGMLFTCGLSNVNLHTEINGEAFPTHGRIASVPASEFKTECFWDGDDYKLRLSGEMHETVMSGRNLSLRRTIETSLFGSYIRITDLITNNGPFEEGYMLLYHTNFGSPFISEDTECTIDCGNIRPLSEESVDSIHMESPSDDYAAQKFIATDFSEVGRARLINRELGIAAELSFTSENLPDMVEWKHLKSHDYCLALEPTNTCAMNRSRAVEQGKIAVLRPYSQIENKIRLTFSEFPDDTGTLK